MVYLAFLLSLAAVIAGIASGQHWPLPLGNGAIVLLAFALANGALDVLAPKPVRHGGPSR